MDNEAEVIREQMEETRTALTEKFEAIEEKLASAVQETAETVTQTAEAVTKTVDAVKEAVEGTVSTVSEKAEEAVESVKEAFDLRKQVEQHPWMMVGGAAALGFAGGLLIDRALPAVSNLAASAACLASRSTSNSQASADGPCPSGGTAPGWMGEVTDSLGPVINRVKGLAIGATVGLLGQMLLDSVPPAFRGQASEVIDQLVTSLGGEKIDGLLPKGNGQA